MYIPKHHNAHGVIQYAFTKDGGVKGLIHPKLGENSQDRDGIGGGEQSAVHQTFVHIHSDIVNPRFDHHQH
jgi:hypothetical protein